MLQSRRLEVRIRTQKLPGTEAPRKDYVHMLNCTLSATERTLCCVLENYQTPDGVK
jgi:seryl-tRNA synthetase